MKSRASPQRKAVAPTPTRPLIWLPPLLALLPAVVLIAFSLPFPWFTDRAEPVYQTIIAWSATLSLLGGVALLWRPLRERAAAELDEVGALSPGMQNTWLGIVYCGITSFFFYIKYCQYRGFQLPEDTAVVSNMAYNFLHGFGFENSIYGVNHFAIHFQPLNALYAPFLLIANSTVLLLFVQCAIVCSAPIAVYRLIQHRTNSASAAAAGLWLCLCSPFMFEIASNNLEAPANLAAFFLWAMVFFERRRFLPAGILFFLAIISTEQTPLALIGLGAYLFFRRDPAFPKIRAWGLGLCAGAAVIFILEMSLINSFPRSERLRDWPLMYGHLGASPGAALAGAIHHPLALLKTIAWPLEKLEPLGRLLWTTGFFCVMPPAASLIWSLNYLPSFLAAPGTSMARLDLHYAAQTIGPVWLAMAVGLSFVFLRLAARKQESLILVWALLVGGWGITHTPRILLRDWRPAYFTEGPAAAAAVPPDASVWASEFLTSWLGCRSRIKVLGTAEDAMLQRHGFMPDYIALSKDWFPAADPTLRRKLAALVTRESYERVLNSTNFIVFKHPSAPLPRAEPRFELPQPIKDIDFKPRVHVEGEADEQ